MPESYDREKLNQTKTGTTTVGLLCKDGIVLVADKQSTAFYVASREEKKLHKITDRIGMTIAGSVADNQYLIRLLRAESSLFRMQRQRDLSVRGLATLLSNIMHSMRIYPYLALIIVGGYDSTGAHLYSVDPLGGLSTGEKFTGSGSGSPIALGVLEADYKENMSVDSGIKLAIKALKAARARDVYTGGNYLDIAVITKDGYKELPRDQIKKLLK